MTKFFAISAALLILFQSFNLDINDVLEMDELVEHYQFHSREYGDNLIVFLSKHYGELKTDHHQKHKEEQKEHEELPFQHHYPTQTLVVFIIDEPSQYDSYTEVAPNSNDNFYYSAFYTSPSGDGPFQPPRFA